MEKTVFNEEKRRYEIYDDGVLCAYIGPDGFGFRKELWKTLQEGE